MTVSAPTIFGRLSETTVWAPKPWVTSSETFDGVEPAPRPQPARASAAPTATLARLASRRDIHPHALDAAASTQIVASSRTACGALTSSVSVPA